MKGKTVSMTRSTFEILEVWKKTRALRQEISSLSKKFPIEEKFRLADQMIRSSRSVTANIAKGQGGFYYQENIQLCRQAIGSLYELLDHLTVALDEKYISNEIFQNLKNTILSLIKMLNGYISFLSKKKGSSS